VVISHHLTLPHSPDSGGRIAIQIASPVKDKETKAGAFGHPDIV
jgi:hypothetical protein